MEMEELKKLLKWIDNVRVCECSLPILVSRTVGMSMSPTALSRHSNTVIGVVTQPYSGIKLMMPFFQLNNKYILEFLFCFGVFFCSYLKK